MKASSRCAPLLFVLALDLDVTTALTLTSPGVFLSQRETIGKAKRYVSLGNKVKQQLGPIEAKFLEEELSEDFEFVAPLVGPLDKQSIIAATEGLDLGQAMPDFDARYHDWRPDAEDERRVWATMRVTGTQTGPLNFAGQTKQPQSPPLTVTSPPEAVSFRFDENGKLREITTGYVMDRRVGTTGGIGGIFGILEGLGSPLPSPLTRTTAEILEPLLRGLNLLPALQPTPGLNAAGTTPVRRKPLQAVELMRLTRRLHASNFGVDDPNLLAPSFTFTGPVVGPLGKVEFLAAYGAFNFAEAFPDLDYGYRDMRPCPFDANRVWYTSSPRGTHTGAPLNLGGSRLYAATGRRWVSPPECGSAEFDAEGRCVALTGGYVMDRRMGNTDGLGGVFGLCEALGVPPPLPVFLLRTPVQNAVRLREKVLGGHIAGV